MVKLIVIIFYQIKYAIFLKVKKRKKKKVTFYNVGWKEAAWDGNPKNDKSRYI